MELFQYKRLTFSIIVGGFFSNALGGFFNNNLGDFFSSDNNRLKLFHSKRWYFSIIDGFVSDNFEIFTNKCADSSVTTRGFSV